MEIEMFDGENIDIDNEEKDIKEEDEENIDLLMTDIYLYAITIMHRR